MNLPKIHSITKKLLVALLGGFLLLFLLFHMTANLFILRHDDGAWYSAFCHFMGTNWVVKVFEVVLFVTLLCHAVLSLWLAITNRQARPVRYRQRSRTKTHPHSKLMMWTGILIAACLILHFFDFYFVKVGWVDAQYMVRTDSFVQDEYDGMLQQLASQGLTGEDVIAEMEEYASSQNLSTEEQSELDKNIQMIRDKMTLYDIMNRAVREHRVSADGQWIHQMSKDDCDQLRAILPEADTDPDFYYIARQKFSVLHIVLSYLFFFVVVFMHLSHAFPSAFQTLGLNGYKYNGWIAWCGKFYAWIILIGFSAVPILIYLGF